MTLDQRRNKNPSKKRFRDDDELQPEEETHTGPTPFVPLRVRKRRELLANVIGGISIEAKQQKESDVTMMEESDDERGSYPDDKVLLDLCFGGITRSRTIKRSSLLVTITTNKTAFAIHSQTDIDNFKRDMLDMVKEMLEDKSSWVPKLNTEAWGVIDVDFSKPSGNDIIEGTKIKAEVREVAWEEGSKYKRVHLHIMATLTYQNFNGYFHVNKRSLWSLIRESFPRVNWGERLPYINLRFIKNAMDSVAEYINKLHNQTEYETLAKRTLDRINEYKELI